MHLLSLPLAEKPSAHFQDIFSRCLLCGACASVCSRDLPVTELVARARSQFPALYGKNGLQKVLTRKVLLFPPLLRALVRAGISLQRIKALPIRSGLRIKLGLLEDSVAPEEEPTPDTTATSTGNISYFDGCFARHLQPSISRAVTRLTNAAGSEVSIPEAQCCCGLAAFTAGKINEARELAWRNITTFRESSGPVLTSCGSCWSHLRSYPELFADDPQRQQAAQEFSSRVVEFSAYLLDQLKLPAKISQQRNLRVFYHDPCHLRFTKSGRETPRRLLDNIPGLERIEAAAGPRCCGQGGLFHIGYPDLSGKIFRRCLEGAMTDSPNMVVTTCSGCLMQWQQGVVENDLPVIVQHLALLLASRLEE